MSGCNPSTYGSIVFLKSWISRTGSSSIWVSRLEAAFGAECRIMVTVFSQHDVEKKLALYGYTQIWLHIWKPKYAFEPKTIRYG